MVVINIDTAKDSHEDIRKTIRYLQELVGDDAAAASSADPSSPFAPAVEQAGDFSSMMNIFGDDAENSSDAASPESASSPSSGRRKRSEATQLIEESDEVEVEMEDDKDSFIEIVEYD